MQYLHFLNFELLFQCLLIVIYSYAVVIAIVEVSIFYAFLPVLLYILISYISLTTPEEYFVIKVLGKNRRAHLEKVNLSDIGSEGFYPCIAYQAAALDSSDDALNAVKSVCIFIHTKILVIPQHLIMYFSFQCYRNGCKFVHVDVRITCDGVAVIGHLKNVLFSSISAEKSIEESSFCDLSICSTSTENSE